MPPQGLQTGLTYKPVTHVIFDMDGLLIDSERYYSVAMQNVTSQFGKPFTWGLKVQMMGTKSMDGAKIAVRELDLPISPDRFLELVDLEYPKVFSQVEFMPGAERLLEHLKANDIPCCIASSSKRVTFEMKTKKFGKKFEEGHFFDHILLASNDPDVKRSKPAPDTFLVARSRFKEPKPTVDQCLVFEDSVSGVLAGVRAGMQTIMVPDERLDIASTRQQQVDFLPTEILSSLELFRPELYGLPPFPVEEDDK